MQEAPVLNQLFESLSVSLREIRTLSNWAKYRSKNDKLPSAQIMLDRIKCKKGRVETKVRKYLLVKEFVVPGSLLSGETQEEAESILQEECELYDEDTAVSECIKKLKTLMREHLDKSDEDLSSSKEGSTSESSISTEVESALESSLSSEVYSTSVSSCSSSMEVGSASSTELDQSDEDEDQSAELAH